MSLQDRLATIERHMLPGHDKRQAIIIMGGLPPGDGEDAYPYTAEDGAMRWTRRPGEAFEAFRVRVMADPVQTTGVTVFGGLPLPIPAQSCPPDGARSNADAPAARDTGAAVPSGGATSRAASPLPPSDEIDEESRP
jgi:hypothetical protein